MFVGYGLILAIPLIGLTSSLELVIILLLLDRLGKALRTPSRDTIVSVFSKNIGGLGKAFRIHSAVDQIGAIIGPLLLAAVLLFTSNNYQAAFLVLIIPFVLMMIVISYTYRRVGKSIEAEVQSIKQEKAPLSSEFRFYCLAVFLSSLGLIPVALILFSGSSIVQPLGRRGLYRFFTQWCRRWMLLLRWFQVTYLTSLALKFLF